MAGRAALFDLRRECRRAKEELSVAAETDVLVPAPHGQARVHVTRAELEELVRPALQLTVAGLSRAIRSCGLRPADVEGVLLVGGAARMPLVGELIRAALPVPLAVEPEPQSTAAAGAALAAVQVVSPQVVVPPGSRRHDPVWTPQPPAIAPPQAEPAPIVDPGPPPRPPVKITPLKLPRVRLLGLVGGHS
jgi:sugar (pentulose or hexulose) kinase